MAAGDGSHLVVQTSYMLLVPTLISVFISIMPCRCLLYLAILTAYTRN